MLTVAIFGTRNFAGFLESAELLKFSLVVFEYGSVLMVKFFIHITTTGIGVLYSVLRGDLFQTAAKGVFCIVHERRLLVCSVYAGAITIWIKRVNVSHTSIIPDKSHFYKR